MDIFDNIAKKLTDAADYTIKEAEKFTGTAKIKFAIMNKESSIDDLYLKIGQYYYDQIIDSSIDNSIPIQAACDEISQLQNELKALNDELASLKNYKICVECGTKIDREMAYCYKCGKQQ